MTTSSLPQLNSNLKAWLGRSLRIDAWGIDMPSAQPKVIGSLIYPANIAVQFPPSGIEFERNSFGLSAKADFSFRIIYRIPKALGYDALPITSACAVINNLFYDAVINPAAIDSSIIELRTPRDGLDIQVSDPTTEDNDWLMVLNPNFNIQFKASRSLENGFDPPPVVDPVIPITQLDLSIYRGDIEFSPSEQDTFDLDRIYHLRNE